MESKLPCRIYLAALVLISFISISWLTPCKALADAPIIVTGQGNYQVDLSNLFGPGVDFDGDFTVAYVERAGDVENPEGIIMLTEGGGKKINAIPACFFDEFVEDYGFYTVVGKVINVMGYSDQDRFFPKIFDNSVPPYPQPGDFILLGMRDNNDLNGNSQTMNQVTIPFLFPPNFFGVEVNCETLISPLGPPINILEATFGDLLGHLSVFL